MSETAIGLWKTQSKILIERGTFELEDAPLLLAYCNSFHLMITAEKVITKLALKDLENLGLADLGGTGGLKNIRQLPSVTTVFLNWRASARCSV
ncbi:hypothetical protein P2W49_09790 [Yersinia intermedia]|nr:hypothetical protein P2W49_09790 [Yersinia intermedia]